MAGGGSPAVDPPDLLAEANRTSERILDHQIRMWGEMEDKAEHLMRLSLATLAGAVALTTLFVQVPDVTLDGAFFVLFLAAGVSVVVALLMVLTSYVGLRADRRVALGPAPAWLRDRLGDSPRDDAAYQLGILDVYADSFRENREKMDLARTVSRRAIRSLVVGVALSTGAFIYLVGGTIL